MHMICTLLPKIEAARAKPDSMIVGGRGWITPVADDVESLLANERKAEAPRGPPDINSLRRS
jgi:hypothetical protein